jgi:hypothetical protein
MYWRLIAALERLEDRVQMYIKSAVKFPIEVVEIPCLPNLGGLAAGVLKTKSLDCVFYD